jgi:signal transduction histidine kinase
MASADGAPAGRPRARLRTGFLVVVVFGAILPLALLGLWLATSAQRSAEALVRHRVEQSLAGIVQGVGVAWTQHRAALLRLVESDAVLTALGSGTRLDLRAGAPEPADPATADAARLWAGLDGVVQRAVLRDAAGNVRGTMDRGPPPQRPEPALLAAQVPVRLPVHRPGTGERLGMLEAWVRAGALLPGDLTGPGVTGSLLALFDPDGGSALSSMAMDPGLFGRARFDWGGDSWAVAHHRLFDPPLVLALAGPIGDFAGPFDDAARQGLLALLAVTLAAMILTGLVSRRLTRPLAELAEAADAVAAGQLDRAVPAGGPDEVHRVARAFNGMTAGLRSTLDRLSQREAVAAVGELAASIAHEVRNPLTAIRLNLERAGERLPAEDEAAVLVRRALRDVERLDASVGDVLQLARSGRVELRPTVLAGPVRAAVAAAAPRFAGRDARLDAPGDAELATPVLADDAALEQLLLNLLLNAADALPAGGSAGVRIETTSTAVRVVVWDRGAGMPAEIRQRVLDPFFSTRPEGTGLGLTLANRVALAHGRALEVDSEPGRGTEVAVTLRPAPPAPADRGASQQRAPSDSGRRTPSTGPAEAVNL